ncbi:Bifunctional epoxide hydrolase 2 [Cucurbita argyrosperma subsp. argyrosperma]|nr:Bifunctional epoxide hydrolase 2 [Cucurbita argyrosperma subsp. argyrosperma]
MDKIEHIFVEVHGGLKIHVAAVGTGSNVVVFLHGFPEIWYSWRHQMIAVASAGFRAIALDYRGYGLSDSPVFLVGKDFGAMPAYYFAIKNPDRALGVVTLGEPGRAEADFGRFDPKTVVKNVYVLFSRSEIPIAQEHQEDYVLKFPGIEEYVRSEKVKDYVPKLEIVFLPEGSHFVQEQCPEEVNQLLLTFLSRVQNLNSSHSLISLLSSGMDQIQHNFIEVAGLKLHVIIVGKDFGAWPAYYFALKHPERALGVVTLGVPFMPPGSVRSTQSHIPEGEPGRAEADFGRFDAKTVVRNVYILFSKSEMPIAQENQEIMDLVDPSTPLPPWFTEEDLATYGALYEKSGFDTALKVPYRSFNEDWGIKDPKVEIPALFIVGEKDYVLKFPGIEEYVRSGRVKEFVPKLEIIYLPEGSHFVQEQSPEEVNQLLLTFLANHF